jgi:hypothetical protein
LEQAFGAQVTFIDNNGNYVTLNTEGNEEDLPGTGVAVVQENAFNEVSEIALKQS